MQEQQDKDEACPPAQDPDVPTNWPWKTEQAQGPRLYGLKCKRRHTCPLPDPLRPPHQNCMALALGHTHPDAYILLQELPHEASPGSSEAVTHPPCIRESTSV